MSVATLILMGPAIMAVFAFCAMLQRRRAVRDGAWRCLTPGPMFWAAMVSGISLTGVFTLVSFSDQSSPFIVAMAGFFNVLTIVTLVITVREDVRWNATHLQRRTVTGEIRRIAWSELAAFGYEPSGYHWVRSYAGPKIRFTSYCHGFEELMAMIRHHLPDDGPPTESVTPPLARIATA